jgi:hypothetical protein
MPTTRLLLAFPVLLAFTPAVLADPCPCSCPVRGTADLVRMSEPELEALYRGADVGVIPAGSTRGRAIYHPGTRVTVSASRAIHVLWKGKVFRDDGIMINRTFAGRHVTAQIYLGESWLDGRPSVVLDYADTSKLFRDVRDEMRQICPGLYLGLTHVRKCTGPELAMYFALDDRPLVHR